MKTDLDSKLQILEDKKYIDQIYQNIKNVNNKFANVDTVSKQYIKLNLICTFSSYYRGNSF